MVDTGGMIDISLGFLELFIAYKIVYRANGAVSYCIPAGRGSWH